MSQSRTTVDISDMLLTEAHRAARHEWTTLKPVAGQELRAVPDEQATRPAFTLRDADVTGYGLRPGVRGMGWEEIRDMSYGERA
ncbi:DUF2191 domain-containing protein [Streptomyces sp. NPDC004134]|uniref:DUF2191 domain-containing protein n=1 Tax=Streptomyces sp. NPDC004134 TaxID=3364691 RepID=UPI0036738533